ncbi:unnamed protein product [Moneuplotes crassus]|uniref:Uncharacterized protein n=1 Tax=Euplotes crassus TaxID=5936 RepID=A0AAD1XD11_EUPCR|nr:unnamed protein product [Moneuplotes crassus]
MGNSVVCPLSEYVFCLTKINKTKIRRKKKPIVKQRQKYYDMLGIRKDFLAAQQIAPEVRYKVFCSFRLPLSPSWYEGSLKNSPGKKSSSALERGRALSEASQKLKTTEDLSKESTNHKEINFSFVMENSQSSKTENSIHSSQSSMDSDDFEDLSFKNKLSTGAQSPDIMRQKYLSKLTMEKVWLTPASKPKSHQSIIILDWDDTLLCTSYLTPKDSNIFSLGLLEDTKINLEKLEGKVYKILDTCINKAQVYIITNAKQGWVEFSCKTYIPKVEPLLDKVTIISARSRYEKKFPQGVNEWKMHAFLDTKAKLEKGAVTNIICIGDSQTEIEAGHKLYDEFPFARIKTIKLKPNPTLKDLNKELKALLLKLPLIIDKGINLSIKLDQKVGNEEKKNLVVN